MDVLSPVGLRYKLSSSSITSPVSESNFLTLTCRTWKESRVVGGGERWSKRITRGDSEPFSFCFFFIHLSQPYRAGGCGTGFGSALILFASLLLLVFALLVFLQGHPALEEKVQVAVQLHGRRSVRLLELVKGIEVGRRAGLVVESLPVERGRQRANKDAEKKCEVFASQALPTLTVGSARSLAKSMASWWMRARQGLVAAKSRGQGSEKMGGFSNKCRSCV